MYSMYCSREHKNKIKKRTSGSVVEYRLAKARVAGSNPVSCSSKALQISVKFFLFINNPLTEIPHSFTSTISHKRTFPPDTRYDTSFSQILDKGSNKWCCHIS